jgi:hypothetical protein
MEERKMNAEEKLEELSDYIAAITAYYMNVLLEEISDHKREYINGKLDALRDIKKKRKKLDKVNSLYDEN